SPGKCSNRIKSKGCTMELLVCPRCGGEFYLYTGCSCCGPPSGLHYCPECGAVLQGMKRSCSYMDGWEFD
ncbi:MAG: hypothetical protein PHH09_13395, partial [Methanoregulaceae archaeon]|nr:hypothetical protein [Methanoregulaceae archaeon]